MLWVRVLVGGAERGLVWGWGHISGGPYGGRPDPTLCQLSVGPNPPSPPYPGDGSPCPAKRGEQPPQHPVQGWQVLLGYEGLFLQGGATGVRVFDTAQGIYFTAATQHRGPGQPRKHSTGSIAGGGGAASLWGFLCF